MSDPVMGKALALMGKTLMTAPSFAREYPEMGKRLADQLRAAWRQLTDARDELLKVLKLVSEQHEAMNTACLEYSKRIARLEARVVPEEWMLTRNDAEFRMFRDSGLWCLDRKFRHSSWQFVGYFKTIAEATAAAEAQGEAGG